MAEKSARRTTLTVLGKQSSRPVIGARYKPSAPDYTDGTPVNPLEYVGDGDGENAKRKVLKIATLSQLVNSLSSAASAPDMTTLQNLILAHAHFVPSLAFFSRLVAEFEREATDAQAMQRKLRVLNIIKSWLAIPSARSLLLDDAPELSAAFDRFLASLKATNVGLATYLEAAARLRSEEQPSYEPASPSSSPVALADLDAQAVARELCLRDQSLLQALELPELYKTRWVTSGAAPHIELAAECANLTSYFFATRLLGAGSSKAQLRAWSVLVAIGAHLLELQNYQSLLSVFLAIKLPPVQRAIAAFRSKDVPKRALKQWAAIEGAMSPQGNFGGYRALLKEVRPPLIPCYEVHLKDLLYHTEGSSDFPQPGVLNVQKLDGMGHIINVFVQAQHAPFDFPPDLDVRRALALSNTSVEQLQAQLEQLSSSSSSSNTSSPLASHTASTHGNGQGRAEASRESEGEDTTETSESNVDDEISVSMSSSASASSSLTRGSKGAPRSSLGTASSPSRRPPPPGVSTVPLPSSSSSSPTNAGGAALVAEKERDLERRTQQLAKRERSVEKRERALARQAEEDQSDADSLRLALERKHRELMTKETIIRELRAKVTQLEETMLAEAILHATLGAAGAPGSPGASSARSVMARRMDQKEGGVKVPVPQTCAELAMLAGHQLKIQQPKAVRNMNYHKISDTSTLQDGSIVYITTEQDEFKMGILGL